MTWQAFIGFPETLTGWAATLGFIITGAFALYSMFDKTLRLRKKEANVTDDRLIGLLKDEVSVLQRKSESQGKDIEAMKILLADMQKENQLFRLVFQNRDPDSLAIREEGRAAMKVIYQTQKDIKALYQALTKHFERIEKAETGATKETIVKTKEVI